jgi:hypothetical protein
MWGWWGPKEAGKGKHKPAVLVARLREGRGKPKREGEEETRVDVAKGGNAEAAGKRIWVNQSEVREERFDEEAWNRKMKRWEDWVKRHEKIFGESQWMMWWREVWGYLGPFPSHGSEGVAMVGTRRKTR